jgi:hypothetical protein
MDIESLKVRLDSEGVDPDAYSLGGGFASDAFVLERRDRRWVVYYTERGLRRGEAEYESEDAACRSLLERVLRDPATRKSQ